MRMVYLSLYVIYVAHVKQRQTSQQQQCQHVIVLDVLPTSIPLLRYCLPQAGILFYCHFPDKLLTRNTVNGEAIETDSSIRPSFLARLYRGVLNGLEEVTLNAAHVICVNSQFTKTTVQREFEGLRQRDIEVLYPAISSSSSSQDDSSNDDVDNDTTTIKTNRSPIVSLNRFERKKNVELLLYAYAELKRHYHPDSSATTSIPKVIIAGGYDRENVENIEYMGELRRLTSELQLEPYVEFCPSISDQQRSHLLQTALCVVYTPHLEHFGIVPLESMLAGTPVVCVKSGGPLETVVDGVTGFLCDATPRAFGQALQQLVDDPMKATNMGRAGVVHVQTKFGTDRLAREWQTLLQKTLVAVAQQQRQLQQQPAGRYSLWKNSSKYVWESLLALVACIVLTWLLKRSGWMEPHESILGKLSRSLWKDEL
jgi:glycosyltransferase involved in cell wall biosynthesis